MRATTLAPVAEQVGRVEAVGRRHRARVRPARRAARRARALRTRSGRLRPDARPRPSRMRSARRCRGRSRPATGSRGTGEVVRVPVGPALLGRIVDPLGRPLDGGGTIAAERYEPIERPGTRDHRSRSRQRAGPDRLARRRCHVRAGPRPARADHRRSRHRQDGDRRRLHHQSEDQRHRLRLRRGRPEDRPRSSASSTRSRPTARPSAASSSSQRVGSLRACNGSRPSPASPWRSIFAIAASTRWS